MVEYRAMEECSEVEPSRGKVERTRVKWSHGRLQ